MYRQLCSVSPWQAGLWQTSDLGELPGGSAWIGPRAAVLTAPWAGDQPAGNGSFETGHCCDHQLPQSACEYENHGTGLPCINNFA